MALFLFIIFMHTEIEVYDLRFHYIQIYIVSHNLKEN